MKKFIFSYLIITILHFIFNSELWSQCFEIESILVDACGSPESNNEMLIFRVGNTPLNVNNMSVTWPNNPFLGICQNAVTANNVAWFNSTVQGCGYFLEPVNGILPANRRVFLFTSTNIVQSAHTFPNLNDTVIALFQCPGATSGHFANYDGNPGLRTTIITFSQPSPCSDTVTYNKINLININGGYGGGSALQNGATVLFAPDGTPAYVNPGCNPQYVPFTLNINNPPASACPGDLLFLNASATGQIFSIQWSGGNGTLLGAGLLNPNYQVVPADAGGISISVTATDVCGNTLTQTATINVPVQQNLTLSPSGQIQACQGQSVNINASGGSGSYSWNSGQNTAQITVSVPGTYVVTSSDACYSYTDSVSVAFLPVPTLSLNPNGNQNLCQGNTLQLTASVNTGTPVWSTGQSGNSITVSTGGTYSVSVSNSCGTASDSVQITVTNAPSLSVSPAATVQICAGQSQTITASGAQAYVWSTGASGASETFSQTGTFWVAGSNTCGTDTVNITVNQGQAPVAEISFQGDTVLCPGETLTLTSVNGSATDQWSTGTVGNQTTITAAPVTVTLTVSNACGTSTDVVSISAGSLPVASITTSTGGTTLCNGSSLILTASGGDTYQWSSGATGATLNVTTAGTFTVTASNICGSDTESLTTTVINPPVAQITPGGSTSFCDGDSLLLTGSGGDTYTWSTGETSSSIYVSSGGSYTLTATNACGSNQASITLTLIPLPEVNITTPGPVNLCQGSQITISATANEPVSWSNGGIGPSTTVSSGGTLTALATNACGTSTSTIVINETPLPQVNILQNSPLVACAGNEVQLEAIANTPVQWNNGLSTNTVSVNASGTYVVTASNACGTASDSVQVIITGPQAGIVADPPSGNAPLNVLLSSSSTGAMGLSWNVAGATYTSNSFNHVFFEAGTYDVVLVASDDNGCSDTATLKIVVGDQFEVFIPNVFTPNGDGINDEFKIVATGVKLFRCTIFNRWGNEIYSWDDVNEGWNGKSVFGGRAPSGVYVFVAEITNLSGDIKSLRGHITLFE